MCGDGGQCVEQEAVMSLDKAIEHGKEHRKPYRGSKAIDPSCRNHGGCPWCEENRKFRFREEKNVTLIIFNQMNKNGGNDNGRLQTEDD